MLDGTYTYRADQPVCANGRRRGDKRFTLCSVCTGFHDAMARTRAIPGMESP